MPAHLFRKLSGRWADGWPEPWETCFRKRQLCWRHSRGAISDSMEECRFPGWEGKTALSKSDRQTLENLGEHLGFLDRETQERTLLLYLEQVDTELQVLREHRQERCRLYTSLGVMGGLFLAVILV